MEVAGLQEDGHQEGQPGDVVPGFPSLRSASGRSSKATNESRNPILYPPPHKNGGYSVSTLQASVDRLAPSRALLQGLALFHGRTQGGKPLRASSGWPCLYMDVRSQT